jgi:hypothetical protein
MMSNSRLWFSELTGILLTAFWVAGPFFHAQSRTSFVIRFLVIVVAGSIGRAMSYFEPRAFLALKIVYAIGFAFVFRYFNIASAREDYAFLVFAAGVLFVLTIVPLTPRRPRFGFSVWWAAMKRTFRRLRGDWTQDDERFYSEIRNGSK